MSNDESENQSIEKSSSKVPSKLNLGPVSSLDLSFLPEKERQALMMEYAKGIVDINKKAQELHIDAVVLKKTLDDMNDTAKDATESDVAVTISHSQTTKVGRTEVMMGNTDQAFKGKLSKSQTGEKDYTPYYVGGAILALLIFALMKN
jgi:hypothetical protein